VRVQYVQNEGMNLLCFALNSAAVYLAVALK